MNTEPVFGTVNRVYYMDDLSDPAYSRNVDGQSGHSYDVSWAEIYEKIVYHPVDSETGNVTTD